MGGWVDGWLGDDGWMDGWWVGGWMMIEWIMGGKIVGEGFTVQFSSFTERGDSIGGDFIGGRLFTVGLVSVTENLE